jgi:hypothetical protein
MKLRNQNLIEVLNPKHSSDHSRFVDDAITRAQAIIAKRTKPIQEAEESQLKCLREHYGYLG